jgi:hypothetical protein
MTTAAFSGPQPPYLLEVLLSDPVGSRPRRWQLVQAVNSLDEGLAVASRMCQSYRYRLFLGADYGYLALDWADSETDSDLCEPRWVRTENRTLTFEEIQP